MVRLVVRVRVRVRDRFGSISVTFVCERESAWPAKQRVDVGDNKISVELRWTIYLFIQLALRWSVRRCGTTGVSHGHIGQVRHVVMRLSHEPAFRRSSSFVALT